MSQSELMYYFFRGECCNVYDYLGAHLHEDGVIFRIYAPNAKSVNLVGNFNDWHGQEMYKDEHGVFVLYVPWAKVGDYYKYLVRGSDNKVREKVDPFGFYSELRPKNSSIVYDLDDYKWKDKRWLNKRSKNYDKPLNIYEINIGSWKRHPSGEWYSYRDLVEYLIPYLIDSGYTHVELMPLSEFPFDGSWGYQTSGYFSATSRYGTCNDLRYFIDCCHQNNIGVIIDFVPVHFVKDSFGLIRFDGSSLYEYGAPSDAVSEWGTMNFDLGKESVRSFLISAANFWIDKYHFDGIRFDAIANLIYYGGNKGRGVNQEALYFIKRLNYIINKNHPSVMLMAEDSSDFPGVTGSTTDGLGFDYKWDMGWMNDTLKYYGSDPIYRGSIHHSLTFSMAYFFADRFLLPFSHDEVVHGKKNIIDKMWGNYDQKVAQVKNLFLYQYTHPGKKLNFMGNEIGHFREWDEEKEMDWFLLRYPIHQKLARFTKDLNHIYLHHSELYKNDYNEYGFTWIDADNINQSIYIYKRESDTGVMIVILNMLDVSYQEFEIGVPYHGEYYEIINSEKDIYGGCNMCNYEPLKSIHKTTHKQKYTIKVRIAPFSGIVLKLKRKYRTK